MAAALDVSGLPPPTHAVLVFQFAFPRTKKIALHSIFRTENQTSKEYLSKTSSVRDELFQALDTGSTNAVLSVLFVLLLSENAQALEHYLPYLYGLVVSVENNSNLRLNSPLSL